MNKMSETIKEKQVEKEFNIHFKQMQSVRGEINSVVFGQSDVIEQILITLLAGGHALLVGLPGLAKTRIANFLGIILGLDSKRIQFRIVPQLPILTRSLFYYSQRSLTITKKKCTELHET